MFNFFQKKNKNRSDSDRTSKVVKSDKKSAVLGSKKSELLEKDINEGAKKTSFPANMILHVSEKASNMVSQNSYVFKVDKSFNKMSAKKAVESHYGVKVASVHMLNAKSKKRIRGNIVGYKSGYKKAIMNLKEGFKIEL